MPTLPQPLNSWTSVIGRRAHRPQAREGGEAAPAPRERQPEALASAARVVLLVIASALPVLSISAHVFGALSIDRAARFLVLPMALAALVLAIGRSPEARLFRRGVLGGIVAVTVYDSTRMPFVLTGVWPDFIPNVGGWVIDSDEPHAFLGYFWRYLGNGGGIAAVFVLACAVLGLRSHLVGLAVAYGVFVWSGLVATVLLSTNGQDLLFRISPLTFVMSLVGHLVYGAVLGLLLTYMIDRNPSLTELPVGRLAPVARLRCTRPIRAFR